MAKGKSLDEFIAKHDKIEGIKQKIAAALADLNGWEYERDFCRKYRISTESIPRFRELFSAKVVPINETGRGRVRYIWCGSVALAKQISERVNQ